MSTNTDFISLVPAGWIKDYLLEMQACNNEMPMPFHFLSASVVVGSAIGFNAWATLATNVRVYPNVNALLLSPAGKCRRSEGSKITVAIARAAGLNVLSGKATPEGLIDELMDNPKTLLYCDELSVLFTKQDFQVSIIPTLTDLLLSSGKDVNFRKRSDGQKVTLSRPCLSTLFTTAPDWFITTMPEAAFGGGLMSRFLVCCLDDREVYHADLQAEDDPSNEALNNLARRLSTLSLGFQGRIPATDEASQWFTKWYLDNETRQVEDDRNEPHRNRKPANLLRIAMVLGAAAEDPQITVERLEHSQALLDRMEPTLLRLYGLTEEVTLNGISKGEKRVLSRLRAHGSIKHSDLARSCASYFRGGTKDMRVCLDGLIEKGLVQPEYRSSVRAWPPKKWHYTGETKAKALSN